MTGRQRRFRPGSYPRWPVMTAATLLLAACLVLVALISLELSARADLTITGRYTLSRQSADLLKGLGKPVEAIGFYSAGDGRRQRGEDLLRLMAEAGDNFQYEIIDPERRPGATDRFRPIASDTVVLTAGSRWEKVASPKEASLVSAVARITGEPRRVYFLTGHGEKDLEDDSPQGYRRVADALRRLGYEPLPLSLTGKAKVPAEAALIVVAGPKKDLFPQEAEVLDEYTGGGGSLVILLDPGPLPGFENLFTKLGLKITPNVIVDKSSRLFGSDNLMPVIKDYSQDHPITSEIKSITFFPVARALDTGNLSPGSSFQPLARTGEQSWAEFDLTSLLSGQAAAFDPLNDQQGPVAIALAGEVRFKNQATEEFVFSRVVAVGDSDFAANTYFDQGANGDLFIKAVHWADRSRQTLSLPALDQEFYPISLEPGQIRLIFWLTCILPPVVVLVLGVIVLGRMRWRG